MFGTDSTPRNPRWNAIGVATAAAAALGCAGCASEGGPADGALDADQARAALTARCAETEAALTALIQPTDDATRVTWTAGVATILQAEADAIRAFVVLDDELRVDVRAFADNTAEQAMNWTALSELLADGGELGGDGEVGEVTTEITELSLGRDDLSTELEVESCRRR